MKEVLINNNVSPNDHLYFSDNIKKYISDDNFDEDSDKRKQIIKNELFELISDNDKIEINIELLKLFLELFLDMNKDSIKFKDNEDNEFGFEVIDVENIDKLKGLDNLWNIIIKIKDEKILSFSINIMFQIYKNNYKTT